MAKKQQKNSSLSMLTEYSHHLIPSTLGGIVVYAISGLMFLSLLVFAVVWVGHMIGHSIHSKK